jgi:hypothetical protein
MLKQWFVVAPDWRNDNLLGGHVREVACLPGDLQK